MTADALYDGIVALMHWITAGGERPLLTHFLSVSCSVLLVITNSLVPLS
jgi:hypothetical protein